MWNRGCQGLEGMGSEELVFMGKEFHFERMKEFWRWMVVIVA